MSISDDLIRQLASRRESPTLDFKEKFYENSPDGNAELAKDIMAMANSLHNGESGYLLFGVGEDPVVHLGIIKGFVPPQWVTDSNLHEKVKLLLNRVPAFSWSQVDVDGCMIGVIEIRAGKRPFFPLKDIKHLKRHVALHRIGSSTDIASPDEIVAWARADDARRIIELEVEQREQSLAVTPGLENGVSMRTGSMMKRKIIVRNDGKAIFTVSSARCVWRLREQKWRQWLESASMRYLAEVPPFAQNLNVPAGAVREGEYVFISIIADLGDVHGHVMRHWASSVEGEPRLTPPLDEFLVGEVAVKCQGLSRERTKVVETVIDF